MRGEPAFRVSSRAPPPFRVSSRAPLPFGSLETLAGGELIRAFANAVYRAGACVRNSYESEGARNSLPLSKGLSQGVLGAFAHQNDDRG
jgi:hypothetical protein